MPMTFDERAAAVQQLTIACEESPRLYRVRVVAWILLGYAIIVGLLTLSLALSVGVIAAIVVLRGWILLKFAWIPIVASWLLIRSLFVRIDPPAGRVLLRREAPALFSTIDEIRTRLGVRPLNRVLLVNDMNAAVVEMPRFGGLFGWQRYLLIGAPLLLVHSLDEMKAILAHELGHLSGRHGRVTAWSWRVRVTWTRVLQSIDQRRGRIATWLQPLFHWYYDRLMCVTLVQARAQELAADGFAVQMTNAETAARALAWNSVATALLLRRFWQPLWERAGDESEPPRHPLNDMLMKRRELLAAPFDDVTQTELARATALDDTHPSLRDRLKRIGVPNPTLAASPSFAAEALFGRSTGALIAEVDQAWRAEAMPMWQARHQEIAASRKLLSEMDVDDVTSLDDERLHKRAESLAELGRDDEALAIYQDLASRNPNEPRAAFHIGRILLHRGDLEGLTQLSRAMEHDWRAIGPSCQIAYAALREKGLEREADAWLERYRQEQARLGAIQAEAATLAVHDNLGPSDLPAEVQEHIRARCFEAKWVGKIWIARKNLSHSGVAVNFVAVRGKFFRFAGNKRFQKLVQSLGVEVMVFLVESGTLMRRLDRIPGARRFCNP
ncbi:MAG: M48 family metalloprotease [Thermoanaerobaculia bacterium]